MKKFGECSHSQILDSVTIENKLLGSWEWEYASSAWDNKIIKANKKVVVKFNNDHTFSQIENDISTINGIWKIADVDWGALGVIVNPRSEYLFGRVYFCNDEVMFNNSYIDGSDCLFKKVKN